MTLEQFQQAVRMLSEKKYPGDPKAMEKLQSKLSSPGTHPGATVMQKQPLETVYTFFFSAESGWRCSPRSNDGHHQVHWFSQVEV